MSLDGDILRALVSLIDEEALVPTRLSILSYLYFTRRAKYTNLQKKLNLTSGNLSSHLRKLEEMGLVKIFKHFVDLRPTTLVEITPAGVEKIRSQYQRMNELVSAVVNRESPTSEG